MFLLFGNAYIRVYEAVTVYLLHSGSRAAKLLIMGGEGFHLLQIAGWPVFQAKPGGQPAMGTVMKMRLICMRTDPAGKHQQQMLRKPRPHCKLQGQ